MERKTTCRPWNGKANTPATVPSTALPGTTSGAAERAILVAQVEGLIVGQIFVHFTCPWPVPGIERPAGYLYAFRVRPTHRGQGIGRSLLVEGERTLAASGSTHAVIAVSQDNPDARRLYERMGYTWLADDPGSWTYRDDRGRSHAVVEPANLLVKELADFS